jgi:putative transposase
MKRHGSLHIFVTDKLRSYAAAMKAIGDPDKRDTGCWLKNRAESLHLPFLRRERAVQPFEKMRSLQTFTTTHFSIHNHFKLERHLYSRANSKLSRVATLAEWRDLGAT